MNDLLIWRRRTLRLVCVTLTLLMPGSGLVLAQTGWPRQEAPPPTYSSPLLGPEQLDTLVAPVALYPDALLSQVLVASTYPQEVVDAAQWLQQNRYLQGQQLLDAAQQQNWDPSIQALVVFPDVLARLSSDIQWTTDLGNAFLSQQADVMNAVQRLRAQAMASGRLRSNAQETVTTQYQGGQNVVEIVPANPEVVYVPTYNPEYIWGPPAWGYYPSLYYPAYAYGFGFGPGIYIGGFFGGLGWGGWGWTPNWFSCSIFTNAFFFNHYGFHHDFDDRWRFGDRGGRGWGHGFEGGKWEHNPVHRMGVPYSSQAVANRFGRNFAGRGTSTANAANGRFDRRSSDPGANFAGRGNVANRGSFGSGFAGRGNTAGNFANRGNLNSGNRFSATPPPTNNKPFNPPVNRVPLNPAARGGWSHFGGPAGTVSPSRGFNSPPRGQGFGGNANRPAPSYSVSVPKTPTYRSTPSYGGNAYRPAPSYGGSVPNTPTYRSTPSHGGNAYRPAPSFNAPVRNVPAYRSTPSFGGSAYRAAPSTGGWGSVHSAPSVHSSPSFSSNFSHGSGGGFRSGGGGGGSSHGGGGSPHSSGGHRGGRR